MTAPHHAPKHRALAPEARPRPRRRLRLAVLGLAATVTVGSVAVGVLRGTPGGLDAVQAAGTSVLDTTDVPELTAADLADRERTEASRSDGRAPRDRAKARQLSVEGAKATTVTDDASDDDPRDIARALLPSYGWSSEQFGCLDSLWTKESNWRITADNPSSSAYGIPQALPGSKMASAGPNWATNPVTQITWGLGYIQSRYGTPCAAWGHSQSHNWY